MDSDNDIWASSDDENNYDRIIAEKDWERLQENHGNDGYKEGIIEGKEVRMQHGFDKGYIEGLAIGKELGILRGKLSTYLTFYKQMEHNETVVKELQTVYDELDKVDVQHIFSTEYFSSTISENYISPQDKIQQWRRKIDQVIQNTTTSY
ncbi:uncharacterized protein BX664DRAFT_326151 [Halteromyces radiatus]|uniref:uncharacterized protein n=1 Tax=Halteromyces radiatus TaxID=101107 RepID=UPI00221E37BD|nr:uncharacterized protein BX664DRAFT_326151 [Halteromyces radiatus]KAI8097334.1 hypothetical protein BX664DRAFT_326151 [Halteromyces radiatus]